MEGGGEQVKCEYVVWRVRGKQVKCEYVVWRVGGEQGWVGEKLKNIEKKYSLNESLKNVQD